MSIQWVKRYMPVIILAGVLFLVWWSGGSQYLTFAQFRAHQLVLDDFVSRHVSLALLFYSGMYVFVAATAIPAATVLTLASGFFFGRLIGTCATVIAATIGATILFLSTKRATQNFLADRNYTLMHRMRDGFRRHPFGYLLLLRLIPLVPFAAVTIAASFFQLPATTFVVATFVGIIPGTVVYSSIGQALRMTAQYGIWDVLSDPNTIFALCLFFVLLMAAFVYRQFKKT